MTEVAAESEAESEEVQEMRKELMETDPAELKTMLDRLKQKEPDVELPSGGKEEIVAWMVEWSKTKMAEAEARKVTKVRYHPNVRCLRGGGGVGPVIVGPMYRVGEGYVCEKKATKDEKAQSPVAPAKVIRWPGDTEGPPVEGLDLRGSKKADILGLRGADGTLDLTGAILCGVKLGGAQLQGADLTEAQLQGAKLSEAQLQGAKLSGAQLQGAKLSGAQLQGANLEAARLQGAVLDKAQLQGASLFRAQLQGADLYKAQLQGADLQAAQLRGTSLFRAQLQGANLYEAQLQGADLSEADLSVLPKGFLLPKERAPGETEETKKAMPTNLTRANLSVLPKGSKCRCDSGKYESKVKVSDAARPTKLTDAKAGGANFTEADLRGATFIAATLKDATLKDAIFTPLRPPERPASGALSGAAADEDDDDDNSDGSDGESEEDEEESPLEAKVEKSLDTFMTNLATGAKIFMVKADKLLGQVKVRMDTSTFADGNLDQLLLEKLEERNVTQVAFNGILSTEVIRPLLAVLEDELLKLLKPTDEVSAGPDASAARATDPDSNDELLRQLLKTYKLLSATGESDLMKRLSPIIKDHVRAASARAARGRAGDEEQPLVSPVDSANCLVQQLWPALVASLEAQVSDVILYSALAPMKKAGMSVRRMAGRLDELEGALRTEYNAKSQQLAKKFGLVGGEKGGLRSRLLKATLTAATQYEVSVGGFSGSLGMVRLAWTYSRARLTKHENELQYLKEKLRDVEKMTTTDQTWRDVTETWQATLALLKSIEVERGVAVLQCIASDKKLLQALGMAETLYKIKGDVPTDLVMELNDGAGAHIRTHAYKYDKLMNVELVRIQQVRDIQLRTVQLASSLMVAIIIGTMNLPLPMVAWMVAGPLLLCCCTCYHRSVLLRGAGRLCALLLCGVRSTQKTAPASKRAQPEEDAMAATA